MEKAKAVSKQSIRVLGDRLVVDHVVVDDDDVANYFGDVPADKVEKRFQQAVRVGTQALRTVQTYQGIEMIERRFQALDAKFKDRLKEVLDQIDDEFEDKFGEDGTISKLVSDHFGEKGKVEEIFDPGKEGSVTYNLLHEFRRELQGLREIVEREAGRTEVLKLSPKKGTKFEDWCEDVLSEIAKRQQPSDVVERVGAKVEYFGSKKGDFKVTLGQNTKWRIAVEVKDLTSHISLEKIRKYLKTAMEKRGAQYAVLVVKNVESLPKSVGFFNELEGNILVCALGREGEKPEFHPEVVDIAYKWAKLRVMTEGARDLRFDAGKLLRRIDSMKGRMNEFGGILGQVRDVRKVLDAVEARIEGLRDDLSVELRDLVSELKKTPP